MLASVIVTNFLMDSFKKKSDTEPQNAQSKSYGGKKKKVIKVIKKAHSSPPSIRTTSALDEISLKSAHEVLKREVVSKEDYLQLIHNMTAELKKQNPVAEDKKQPVTTVEDSKKEEVTECNTSSSTNIPYQEMINKFNKFCERHAAFKEKLKLVKKSEQAEVEENYEILLKEIKTLQEENTLLAKVNCSITKANIKLVSSDSKSKYEMYALTKKYEELQSELEKLSTKSKENQQLIATLTESNKELEEKLEANNEETATLQMNFQGLKVKYSKLKLQYDSEFSEFGKIKSNLETKSKQVTALTQQLETLKKKMKETELNRRHLHNTIQDMKGNIRVFCRVRPPVDMEEQKKFKCFLSYPNDVTISICKRNQSPDVKPHEFCFDKVFPPTTTQQAVFDELLPLVRSALDGYHICVFAYGQTGSGKTYTMEGIFQDLHYMGIIPRTIELVFETIKNLEKSGWKYKVEASFLEIYNESIRNLLEPNSKQSYEIRYNEGKGTTVTNLKLKPIKNPSELKKLSLIAHKNRVVASTNFKFHSSRSHAITKIHMEGHNQESRISYVGSISLVDLAGSESAKEGIGPERFKETRNINKSLSALDSVILALYNKESHVPYRNSKLTYLLQSCLGGNSKTLLFVNISPFEDCYPESLNSLRFAAKVRKIKTGSKRNKIHTI